VYLLCGSNNVDSILNLGKETRNSECFDGSGYDPMRARAVEEDIMGLIKFIHSWANNCTINLINILPRYSRYRNSVINTLNNFMQNMSNNYAFIKFINTEYQLSKFSTPDGWRKSELFSNKGRDNIHLNKSGLIKFAKYMKYLSHC